MHCPVDGCDWKVGAQNRQKCFSMRLHFWQRHLNDTIIVEEEGVLPRCERCGLFSSKSNSQSHWDSLDCRKISEKKQNYCQAIRQDAAREVVFTVDGVPINRVSQFKYLGRVLDEDDDDNHAALRQLARAKEKWGRLSAALKSQGATARTRGYFYKAVVQVVLLYGSESWTLTESTLKFFRSFHSRVARHLTGRHIRCLDDGTWFCPLTREVLEAAGLETIDEYIQCRRDTIWRFVRPRPLYEACRQSRPMSTNAQKVVWWQL